MPSVFRRVKAAVLTTGDELVLPAGDPESPEYQRGSGQSPTIAPWQIHNSNRIAIESMLLGYSWAAPPTVLHAADKLDQLTTAISAAIDQHDAVILTGGVSMGDYDYVPQAAANIGAETIFHKLPVRPGKPIFAAVIAGKLILGLPGNPVSATIGCRRFAIPLLRKIAGVEDWHPPQPMVRVESPGDKTLPMHWMRLVRVTEHGAATIVPGKGSGDLVAMGNSTGFIEMPPRECSAGPWPYYAW